MADIILEAQRAKLELVILKWGQSAFRRILGFAKYLIATHTA